MDDINETGYRGNTDKTSTSHLYDDPYAGMTTNEAPRRPEDARATYATSEFGQKEEELKAKIAAVEAEDRERGKAWAEARKAEKAQTEAQRLALEEAAQGRLTAERETSRPQPRPLQPQVEGGLLARAGAFLRSIFPTGQRKAA